MRLPTKQIAASSDEEQSAQQGSRACLRVCLCGGGTCRLTMEANADLRRTPRSACACARARAARARWVTRTRCTSPRSRVAPPFARARDRADTSAPSRSRPPLRPATRVHAEAVSAHGGHSALRCAALQWLAQRCAAMCCSGSRAGGSRQPVGAGGALNEPCCAAPSSLGQRPSLATHYSAAPQACRGAARRGAGGSAAMNLGRTWSVWPMYPKYFCTDCHDTRQHE